MAKTEQPNSTGSQFFIVWGDTPLPGQYTVLGKVTKGLELVEKVGADGALPEADPTTGATPPKTEVIIKTMTVTPPQERMRSCTQSRPVSATGLDAASFWFDALYLGAGGDPVAVHDAFDRAHGVEQVAQVLRVGHLEAEPAHRYPVAGRGDRRGQDVDPLLATAPG